MIIFRYLASHALESLRDVMLKVARVSSFNDPFECMYRATGTMTRAKAKAYLRSRERSRDFFQDLMQRHPHLKSIEAARRYLKANLERFADVLVANYDQIKDTPMQERERIMDSTMRVVCFSSSEASQFDEILLWSHYAGMHKGVRIGFEFPSGVTNPFKISAITYQNERVGVDLSVDAGQESVKDALLISTKTKSTAWTYEKEFRLVTIPLYCVSSKRANREIVEFFPIEREWVRRVDFGVRFNRHLREPILNIVKKDYPHAECFQADYHKTDYALTYARL